MAAAIIDPTARLRVAASAGRAAAPRPEALDGLRVGLLENTKRNADRILAALGTELGARNRLGGLVHRTKHVFAMPLPEDLVEELLNECDVVVVGVGDCGSCSASAVADGIALERMGIPTAVVCTESFVAPSQAMAELKGAPEYDFLLTPHPIANLTDDEIVQRARGLVDAVEARLVHSRALVAAAS